MRLKVELAVLTIFVVTLLILTWGIMVWRAQCNYQGTPDPIRG
jgi:hypothetical protein